MPGAAQVGPKGPRRLVVFRCRRSRASADRREPRCLRPGSPAGPSARAPAPRRSAWRRWRRRRRRCWRRCSRWSAPRHRGDGAQRPRPGQGGGTTRGASAPEGSAAQEPGATTQAIKGLDPKVELYSRAGTPEQRPPFFGVIEDDASAESIRTDGIACSFLAMRSLNESMEMYLLRTFLTLHGAPRKVQRLPKVHWKLDRSALNLLAQC